jgi:hypothetical protein
MAYNGPGANSHPAKRGSEAGKVASRQRSPTNQPQGPFPSDGTREPKIEIQSLNDTLWITCPDPKSGLVQHLGCSLGDDLKIGKRLVSEGILSDMKPEGQHVATWFCSQACWWPAFGIWHPDGRLQYKPRAAVRQLLAFRAKLENLCKEDPGRRRTLIYVLSDLDEGIKLVSKSMESLAKLSSDREASARMKRSQKRGQWFRKPESLSYALYKLFGSHCTRRIPHSERCERIARFQRQYLRRDFSHTRQAIENQIKSFKAKPHLREPMDTLIGLLLTYRWRD